MYNPSFLPTSFGFLLVRLGKGLNVIGLVAGLLWRVILLPDPGLPVFELLPLLLVWLILLLGILLVVLTGLLFTQTVLAVTTTAADVEEGCVVFPVPVPKPVVEEYWILLPFVLLLVLKDFAVAGLVEVLL